MDASAAYIENNLALDSVAYSAAHVAIHFVVDLLGNTTFGRRQFCS